MNRLVSDSIELEIARDNKRDDGAGGCSLPDLNLTDSRVMQCGSIQRETAFIGPVLGTEESSIMDFQNLDGFTSNKYYIRC
jgi:hypothetical protein